MQLKSLTDDRAVSPVIGVVLMVAITVILAAVIAAFVIGLGTNTVEESPQTSFAFDYDDSAGELTITHDSGDLVSKDNLYVRGISNSGPWTGTASATVDDNPAVAAGDTMTVSVGSSYTVRVVWQSPDTDQSATLGQDSGPDA